MKKNTAGKTGLHLADSSGAAPLSSEAPGHKLTDYERYRRVSFYFEAVLQQTLEAFGGWHCGEDSKAFLVALASGCLAAGIPEEEAMRWSSIHLGLQASEAEVRLLFRNQYRIRHLAEKKPEIPALQTTAWRLEEFMRRRYVFRFNTWSGETEYRERQSFDFEFRPLTQRVVHSLILNAAAEGLRLSCAMVKHYVASDRVPFFSPFAAYFESLPVWDGVDRIRQLAGTVPCVHKDWPSFFFRWFLGCVARWAGMAPEPQQSVGIPWLYGPGGCGKGDFCLRLLPLEFRSFYAFRSAASSDDLQGTAWRRLALFRLSVDAPGADGMLRRFGKTSGKALDGSRASCILTGSSSSLPFALPRGVFLFPVAVAGLIRRGKTIDYEQLYAQAYELVRSGERHGFTPGEAAAWAVPSKALTNKRK